MSAPYAPRAGDTTPASPSVEIRRSSKGGYSLNIGDRWGCRRELELEAVLSDISKIRDDHYAGARAWQLLLRCDWSSLDAEIFCEGIAATPLNHDEIVELQPLLALLAHKHPRTVAQLFPHRLEEYMLPLCGRHGLRAALRELTSGEYRRREDAAWGLCCFAEAEPEESGVRVPLRPLQRALRRENNDDVAAIIRQALDKLDPLPDVDEDVNGDHDDDDEAGAPC